MGQTTAAGAIDVKARSVEAQGVVAAGSVLEMKTQGDLLNQKAWLRVIAWRCKAVGC